MKYRVGFIGAGNMAFALVKAIKKAKLAKNIIVSDVKKKRLGFVKKNAKVNITLDNRETVKKSDVIFLAVKPQQMDSILDEINDTNKVVISIAAGIKIKKIESKLRKARVVRVMPNTPCLVGEMAAGFAIGKKVKNNDVKMVEELLNSAGKAFYLKEQVLDAVTGLSGSGPAFVARLIEAFVEGGKKAGLSKDIATELSLQTFKGTAALLQESRMTPEELVKIVSSPGGTTIAGRKVLEKSRYKDIIVKTIKRAAQRSRELAK
ncbi:MAG: pyrroline-5-carboxylate reductase [Nanoarchaeota archaeon]|nr:pyrroline-5-carboxylate reductase [Nanoarchaeota archaeon]